MIELHIHLLVEEGMWVQKSRSLASSVAKINDVAKVIVGDQWGNLTKLHSPCHRFVPNRYPVNKNSEKDPFRGENRSFHEIHKR